MSERSPERRFLRFQLNGRRVGAILFPVKWFSNVVAIICLAVWLPVTMHCTLETLPLFTFLGDCCSEEPSSHQESGCTEDPCRTLESGLYMIEDNPAPASFCSPYVTLTGAISGDQMASISVAPIQPCCLSPPEIGPSWLFLQRTALSPRAPSLST